MNPATWTFDDDGVIPNSRLPVLVYDDVAEARDPATCERSFARHGWLGAWRNGIYPFHHFHSTAHEVLGIVAGSAAVMLGGPQGRELRVRRGQVLVLPAGTGHCNLGGKDLLVVGAYPDGMAWDLRRGDPAEHDEVRANIARVPLPGTDPVSGVTGPLTTLWADQAAG
ncbi:MAG: cupin domain-containing protein [Solirubrobacteraceae bacterium]